MLSKDTLYRLYVIEQKTGSEIAKIAGGKSTSTIYNWLKKHSIPRRNRRECQLPVTPTAETLKEFYLEQELSIDSIAKKLGSSESSISTLLDKYGIPKRQNWEKMAGWNKGIPLSKDQRQHLSIIAKQRTGKKSPRYGATLSQETRQKISDSLKGRFRGPNNPNWNGGPPYEREKWHGRYEYKEWRNTVFERDNYTCQVCNKPSEGDIEAHHIYTWKDHPEMRFEVGNGITLCHECHLAVKGKEADFADKFTNIILQANQ